ncbi:MAG: sigma-70 family RNA polymerase sigma factor [Saprospiraceae bacterium]|nr:sigma-70 family RNA polymerase sigma factor [Saprospiraceae bacterium]
MSSEATERELDFVPMLKSGDEQAFALLYDNYSALLFGTILRIVGEQKDAENLLQDCFVKIWQNIERYDPEKGRLATWIINIARNLAIDFKRSKYYAQTQKNQSFNNLVGQDMPHAITQPNTELIGLRQLVEKLPTSCREVIEWMYFEGMTQQEISDAFGIPLGTVKSRNRLAIKHLRAYFEMNFSS